MAERPRWGVVCTARACLPEIARFAAHHIGLGAARVEVWLDAPLPGAARLAHPALALAPGVTGPQALHRRQMENATRSHAACARARDIDWLAHLDSDEFLLPAPGETVAAALAALPPGTEEARAMPAERLAPVAPGAPWHFKLPPQAAGQPRAVLEDLYPAYGLHLRNGLISHGEGKVFCRTGIENARIGIHRLRLPGGRAPRAARLDTLRLGHVHVESWEDFAARLPARRAAGSYSAARKGQLSIGDLFDAILASGGEPGLRDFFETVCTAHPHHLAALAARGMVITQDLQLDTKAQTLFGNVAGRGRN